uniref:Serine and arginine rich splicing factor 9 n=1 Tax=Chinchilla lanigera TaxID=34839 RepID=A0A8C2VPY1_CHILA
TEVGVGGPVVGGLGLLQEDLIFEFLFQEMAAVLSCERTQPVRAGAHFPFMTSGLPPSGSWQDLKDHMREAGDVCYADVQKDGMGMVEYLRKEDMEYALRKLDDTKFRSHEGETSYIRVYPERSTSYGYSRSRSGSRGRDSPYQSRGSPHYFSPFRPY